MSVGIGKKREADIEAVGGDPETGKDLIIDIGITNGGQPKHTSTSRLDDIAAIRDPDAVATSYADKEKNAKYKASVEANGQRRFLPIIATHFGAINQEGVAYLCSVAKTVAIKSGKRGGLGQAMMALFTRLSVRLQRQAPMRWLFTRWG